MGEGRNNAMEGDERYLPIGRTIKYKFRITCFGRSHNIPFAPRPGALHTSGRSTIEESRALQSGSFRFILFLMTWRWASACVAAGLIGGLFAFQLPFREYPGREYEDFPLPNDFQEKTEWAFARLMYPPFTGGGYGYYRGWGRFGAD